MTNRTSTFRCISYRRDLPTATNRKLPPRPALDEPLDSLEGVSLEEPPPRNTLYHYGARGRECGVHPERATPNNLREPGLQRGGGEQGQFVGHPKKPPRGGGRKNIRGQRDGRVQDGEVVLVGPVFKVSGARGEGG